MYEIIYSPIVQEKLAALKSEFEHYFVIYFHKNYFLYYIEGAIRYMLWRCMMKGKILQGRCLESSLPYSVIGNR